MTHKVEKDRACNWYNLDTRFMITPTFRQFISLCAGVEVLDFAENKYRMSFKIGGMFKIEDVRREIAKITEAYLLANPKADQAEDIAIRLFAKQNEQFKFLSNYTK